MGWMLTGWKEGRKRKGNLSGIWGKNNGGNCSRWFLLFNTHFHDSVNDYKSYKSKSCPQKSFSWHCPLVMIIVDDHLSSVCKLYLRPAHRLLVVYSHRSFSVFLSFLVVDEFDDEQQEAPLARQASEELWLVSCSSMGRIFHWDKNDYTFIFYLSSNSIITADLVV